MLIGIGYRKGSGKSLVAEYLENEHSFTAIAFADALKATAMMMFGLSHQELNDQDLKEKVIPAFNITPRQILQKLGMAMRETFGHDIWIRLLEHRIINSDPSMSEDWVVSDCRFLNEVQWIKHHGGALVRIDRGEDHESPDTHRSEVELDGFTGWDHVISNNGSVTKLGIKVKMMMKDIENRNKMLNSKLQMIHGLDKDKLLAQAMKEKAAVEGTLRRAAFLTDVLLPDAGTRSIKYANYTMELQELLKPYLNTLLSKELKEYTTQENV